MRASDLTAQEQKNVRLAMRYLHARCGRWQPVAKALRYTETALFAVLKGTRCVNAGLAFRVARLAAVSIDDVLAGKYPPAGVCRNCGHPTEESTLAEMGGRE